MKLPTDTFLLYEAIPVTVLLRNTTGRTIELVEDPESPWLDFLIMDGRGRVIQPTGRPKQWGDVLIPPGDTVQRTFNITPLYELRQRGQYRLQAEVRTEAIHEISRPARLILLSGHELWRRSFGVPHPEQDRVEYRTYRLLLKRTAEGSTLYAQTEDEQRNLVLSMLPLGPYIPFGQPQAQVDARGHFHVLHRNGPQTFAYHEITPDGEIVTQELYSELASVPRLETQAGGIVSVIGDRIPSAMERVLTEEELNPPPPPPPPPEPPRKRAPSKKTPAR
ncbi:MAG: hypothetical protein RMM51_07380 [Verrucomicrobiae bacterium]|nr:hypothetical protein [Verrucomicrobiae bacterium]